MSFFSFERITRGVLTPRQLFTLVCLLCVTATSALCVLLQSYTLSFRLASSIFVCVPLAIAALVDSARHILPDPLLLVAGLLALCSLVFSSWSEIGQAVLNAVFFSAAGFVMSRFTSLGQGDAKLMAVMGLWLGSWQFVCIALICAVAGAALFVIVLLVAGRAHFTTSIALGPWLVGGSLCAYLLACHSF